MKWKKMFSLIAAGAMALSLAACSSGETSAPESKETAAAESTPAAESQEPEVTEEPKETAEPTGTPEPEETGIDYMVLVNKLNPLPDDWEDELETVHFTNSVGDDVEVETKAYDAYLLLKEDLEKEDIFVDLDSARRSVADQKRIMDEFTKEYGKDYALKTVAQPGYSEHHTGLALDLYLIIDGKDIVENEEMIQYTEIWEKIHEKLADYGFILRYLKDKEHITGYGYEPWHIRYIDDTDAAKEIMDEGITFEGYLGVVNETDVVIDYGKSKLFTEEELEEAAVQIKCNFASWKDCELHRLTYAGDEENTKENIAWLESLSDDAKYTKIAEFLAEFHSAPEGFEDLKPDKDYKEYPFWLGLKKDGSWDIVCFGEAAPAPEPKPEPTQKPTPEQTAPPKVTADPTDETVDEGGSCLYIAKAENADSMIWHFVSPEGKTDVAYNAIGTYFPKLTVQGGESENLTLSTIPLDFNGWKAYCEFTGKGGTAKSGTATTTVKAKPTDTPTPMPTPTPTEEPAPTIEPEDPYVGIFYEKIAGRGEMKIVNVPGSNVYEVTITWPSSAFESTQWTFSGEFDGRALMNYTNCTRVDSIYDDDGNETVEEIWTGGEGQLQMTDEGAVWMDDHKENGKKATFLRES